MNDCLHRWKWLDAIHVTKDRNGNATNYANAVCEHCGQTAWLHGRAPNTRPLIHEVFPTTGRS